MSKSALRKINLFLLAKLPAAYFSGVRVTKMTESEVFVTVKHKWINQNPYKSMYWAVQGMASELTTGLLVTKHINDSGQKISMLVAKQSGAFYKKATGRIVFSCKDENKIKEAIDKTIKTKEGQLINLTSKGFNEEGIEVSSFTYEWTIKAK